MRLSNAATLFFGIFTLLVFTLTATQSAVAEHMYATGRTNVADSDTALLEVTPSPFSVSTASTVIGGVRLSGIDFQPGTNTLYASSGNGGTDAKSLFTVDIGTGVATLVGPTGVTGGAGTITDLAFGLGGTLYGTNYNSLYSIDLGTGAATAVGSSGFGFGNIESLAVDPTSGILYGMTWNNVELYTIDTLSGAATSVGVFADLDAALPGVAIAGFGIDYTGKFFVSAGSQNGQIFSLDVPTLTETLVGDAFSGSVSDIAFLVPEPTSIALVLLAMGSVLGLRRRNS